MRFFFPYTIFCIFSFGGLTGQSTTNNGLSSKLNQKYNRSLDYLASFKIDSAETILDSLLLEIEGTNIESLPFGLRVKARKAEALERDNEGDLALITFQDVKSLAFKSKVWDVYAYTSINLALIYEKIGKHQDCLQNLREAQSTLKKHPNLDFLYPFFCVRISSYHRIYDNLDSAKHYALECLRTYEKHGDFNHGADGYMLMTMLSENEGIEQQIKYAQTSADIFKKLENHTGYCYMMGWISRLLYAKGDLKKALLYSDSTISAAQRSIDGGYDVYHTLYNAFKFRGEIFHKLARHDSSSIYIKKGYELHNKHILQESSNKVHAMDAKFKNDKNALKIKEQGELLKSVQIQRKLLSIIFGLGTFFMLGLFYYNYKLRKAKRQSELQSKQLNKTNKELSKSLNKQIILQGEVHHRVKNNLQVIISLLDLQKAGLKNNEAKDQVDSMSKRIYSMAAIHNLLYQKEDMEFIKLFDYIENLCYHFSNFSIEENKPEFSLEIEDINLNLETSMPIGIIITELLTNSLKYARVEGQKLLIEINIKRKDEGILIVYKDNGPGFTEDITEAKSSGLGFYILESMTRQLQGEITRTSDNGAKYNIYLVEKNNIKEEN